MELFSTEHQFFYNLIAEYYDNPILYRVREEPHLCMYGVQLPTQFLNQKFYIMCTTPHLEENKLPLNELPWNSFQVRTSTNDKYSNLPVIHYTPKNDVKFQIPLVISSRNSEISRYTTKKQSILNVSLLHAKGLEYEYNNEGTLKSALETKQTIFQFSS